MILASQKIVKEIPQTLQIKRKAMAVIKLVLKMITSTICQVITTEINQPLKQVKHAIN
jgi:hypothetical protein